MSNRLTWHALNAILYFIIENNIKCPLENSRWEVVSKNNVLGWQGSSGWLPRVWWPEFNPQDARDRKRGLSPTDCYPGAMCLIPIQNKIKIFKLINPYIWFLFPTTFLLSWKNCHWMFSVPSSAYFASFVVSFLQSALFNKSFALRGKKYIFSSRISPSHRTSYIILAKWKCSLQPRSHRQRLDRGNWTQDPPDVLLRPSSQKGSPVSQR